jgi:hypothetical protein
MVEADPEVALLPHQFLGASYSRLGELEAILKTKQFSQAQP